MSLDMSFTNRAIECERIANNVPNIDARRLFRALARAWRGENIIRIEERAQGPRDTSEDVRH
jgi:hypothetical protein